MNKNIFKAYDIRGVYPEELNEKTAYIIGRAFARFTKAKNIVVGEDGRVSSPALRKELIRGIASAGAGIIFAGRLTTPMFYFAAATAKNAEAGIMVTASHNPGKYNGFKMVRKDITPIAPSTILSFIVEKENQGAKPQKTKIKNINISSAYIKKILSLANAEKIKPIKIVIDAGNGTAGIILPALLKKMPQIKSRNLFFDVDMSFPNHEANPLKEETLAALKKEVIASGAAMGVAYDGDADRIGFVDEKGKIARADIVFSALLPKIFAKNPGATILYDLRSSNVVAEEIKRLGGKSKMTRVGHVFIKQEMKRGGAAAASELSSHFYFNNFWQAECSDLVLLYLLEIIGEQGKPLSAILSPLKKYFHSGEINFEVKDKEKKIAELEKKYSRQAKKISHLDGIRMNFKKNAGGWWWFNVRASNTEPLLRLNMEASDKKLLEEKMAEIKKIIEAG